MDEEVKIARLFSQDELRGITVIQLVSLYGCFCRSYARTREAAMHIGLDDGQSDRLLALSADLGRLEFEMLDNIQTRLPMNEIRPRGFYSTLQYRYLPSGVSPT